MNRTPSSRPPLARLMFIHNRIFAGKKAIFATALRALGGTGDFRVVLRFSGATADRVAEREWHETQKLRWLRGGQLEFAMTLGALGEAERWVLGWGAEAEVVEPNELRESVRKTALAIARNNG